jgi:hypothetical protein
MALIPSVNRTTSSPFSPGQSRAQHHPPFVRACVRACACVRVNVCVHVLCAAHTRQLLPPKGRALEGGPPAWVLEVRVVIHHHPPTTYHHLLPNTLRLYHSINRIIYTGL